MHSTQVLTLNEKLGLANHGHQRSVTRPAVDLINCVCRNDEPSHRGFVIPALSPRLLGLG